MLKSRHPRTESFLLMPPSQPHAVCSQAFLKKGLEKVRRCSHPLGAFFFLPFRSSLLIQKGGGGGYFATVQVHTGRDISKVLESWSPAQGS